MSLCVKYLKACLTCSLIFVSLCVFSSENKIKITSVTDFQEYREFCEKASTDNDIFDQFKREPVITGVIQTVDYNQGLEFYLYIKNKYMFLSGFINGFKFNDSVGQPICYEYGDFGYISPTNLRYIKIGGDIFEAFSDRSINTICEIGSGYGGQCKILHDLLKPKRYLIVDLPQTMALAKRHCNTLGLVIECVDMEELDVIDDVDFVVSNYAFSECALNIQKLYLEKIIKKSNCGYMIYNDIACHSDGKSLNVHDFIRELEQFGFYTELTPENPLTGQNNYIVIWKR